MPQAQTTQSILQAFHQAALDHDSAIEQQQRDKQLAIAQQEANTSASRLGTETPLINAQVTEAQNRARAQALDLVNQARINEYLTPGANSTPHPAVASVAGSMIHSDVPLTPLQADTLNISSPVGQNLAQPTAPASANSTATPQAQPASGEQGPSLVAPVDRDTNEMIRLAGGVTPSEQDAINFARQQLGFNPTHEARFNSRFEGWHELRRLRFFRYSTEPAQCLRLL